MKTYEVICKAKLVSVRVGTEQASSVQNFGFGSRFETAPAFVVDLLAQKLVKEVESSKKEESSGVAAQSDRRAVSKKDTK